MSKSLFKPVCNPKQWVLLDSVVEGSFNLKKIDENSTTDDGWKNQNILFKMKSFWMFFGLKGMGNGAESIFILRGDEL